MNHGRVGPSRTWALEKDEQFTISCQDLGRLSLLAIMNFPWD